MDIRFAIRIESDNRTFRYATKRTTIREFGVADIEYQPYIQKISVPEMITNLDFESSVPTVSVSIWDAHRDIANEFNDIEYEALNVAVIAIVNGVKEGEHLGYMSDVKHDAGITSFTVRMEIGEAEGFPREFLSHQTFEYAEVLSPVMEVGSPDVEVVFEPIDDTGWEMVEYVEERTTTFNDSLAGSSTIILHRGWDDNVLQTRILIRETAVIEDGEEVPVFRGITPGDPGPFFVNIADMADASWGSTVTESDPLLVRYSNIENAGGRIRLTGIPSTGPYSIDRTIKGGTIVSPAVAPGEVEDGIAMTLRGDNERGSSIRAPRLFVRASKNIPLSIDDPKLGVGFIDLGLRRLVVGEDLHLFNKLNPDMVVSNVAGSDRFLIPVYHRYHIDNMARVTDGPNEGSCILEIVLNINGRDPGLRYRLTPGFNRLYMYGSSQTSGETALRKLDRDVRLVECIYYARKIKFMRDVVGVDGWEDPQIRPPNASGEKVKAALVKSRIDMIRDVKALSQDLSTNVEQDSVEAANLLNVNNATGKFGVCSSSRLIESQVGGQVFIFEECSFDTPPTEVEMAFYSWLGIPEEKRKYNFNMSNYFTYLDDRNKDILMEEDESNRGAGKREARAFFSSNIYRVKHSPVPENPQDIGKMFPIVYGHVSKVPLIHSVSKKTSDVNKLTAGDDVYIYASHKCGIESATDITVHVLRDDGTEGLSDDEMREFMLATRDNVVESPFPFKKTIILPGTVRSNEGDYGVIQFGTEGEADVYNPYHKVDTFTTRSGRSLYGVKLRGEEWNEKLGFRDPIYPIRNGIGNSTLYGSFNGYIDEDGSITGRPGALIEHPMDVIKHYLPTYGNTDYILDAESANAVKALTPKYHVSMYHVEQMTVDEVVEKICKQFGILRFRRHGILSFATPVMDSVNMGKPLSENVNLIIGTKEDSEGYKTIYNEVTYSYRKNWATGEFDAHVRLTPTNNFYCAQADKARGGKGNLVIEADFVSSPAVAYSVASRIATMNSSRKVIYTCEAKYVEGIRFVPGDIIPMTYKHYNMVDVPVMVVKVQEDFDTIKLEVVRFTNLIK